MKKSVNSDPPLRRAYRAISVFVILVPIMWESNYVAAKSGSNHDFWPRAILVAFIVGLATFFAITLSNYVYDKYHK